MTPLAMRTAKELLLPMKQRSFDDHARILTLMGDIHCFECTDIVELAHMFAGKIVSAGIDERSTFLPAPKTWIEYQREFDGRKYRVAILLLENQSKTGARRIDISSRLSFDPGDMVSLDGYRPNKHCHRTVQKLKREFAEMDCSREFVLALLSIINTPKIVGRRQHMPHRGFERNLLRAQKVVGHFPLHAWTEIKLQITPPRDAFTDEPIEAHLTGKKALHFCRAHLGIRWGKLVPISSCWKGNGALGIKRSRYRLKLKAA